MLRESSRAIDGHECLTFIDILMIFSFQSIKKFFTKYFKVSILNMHNKREILYFYMILNCHQQHHASLLATCHTLS